MSTDPTAPLDERTPEQVSQYLDDHILMALDAAERLYLDRLRRAIDPEVMT